MLLAPGDPGGPGRGRQPARRSQAWLRLLTRLRSAAFERGLRLAPGLALRRLPLDKDALGRAGERLAARALERRGYCLLGERIATRAAEVDLVALDGTTLVCAEVKTGRSGVPRAAFERQLRWRPGHRFGAPDLERCRRAAASIAPHTLPGHGTRSWRVDLIEVVCFPGGRLGLYHHPGLVAPLARPAPSPACESLPWAAPTPPPASRS